MDARTADPYGTAGLRRRVLDGWSASPSRFREDANAEEDHALGGYRDRAVVELAQNAADAALRAGVPGRLLLRLDGGAFTAANTGAPLTAEGVESMSTLRASAKRGGDGAAPVGRFGVGFASVAALSDDVTAASRDGAVRWSAEAARAEIGAELLDTGRADPGLAEELHRRGGALPLLRLPFPAEAAPEVPDGYDTAVTLLLRDAEARATVARLLAQTGPALLLALPALTEVRIEAPGGERVLTRADRPSTDPDLPGAEDVLISADGPDGPSGTHWRTLTRTGRFAPGQLADRPVEERDRPDWTLTWATALDAEGRPGLPPGVPRVLHAPTPSDTPLDLPALLIASFPLTPDRRGVAPGPAADALLAEAAEAYAELLCRLAPHAALDLVPQPVLGGGEFDGRFRALAGEPLQDAPFLRTAGGEPVSPRDAVLVEGGPEVAEALAGAVPAALPGDADPAHPGLARLRVRRIGPAELADLLAELDREPAWWARLYAALRGAVAAGADADELGALPVPLADGRTVRGPRSLLIPGPGVFEALPDPRAPAPLGLRIVHPDAADPLLVRLGAVEAGPFAVLSDAQTRAAVQGSLDAEDPDAIAAPVLALAAASGASTADLPWLAELALRDDEDGYSVAGELLLPESPLREVFTDDAPFGLVAGDLVERYGARLLAAVGVLDGFTVVRAEDVTLGEALEEVLDDLPLDGLEEWAEEVAARLGDPDLPPTVPELVAVADLEFVREDRWPRALELLAGAGTRAAVTDPARVLLEGGRSADVPSYTAWWLRTGALLGGAAPGELRLPDADPVLHGLYEPAPKGVDAALARAIGVRGALEDLLADPDGPDDLLDRLADPERRIGHRALHRLWTALAGADPDRVEPPERVRAVQGGAIVVADAEDALVVDAPDLLPLLADRPVLLPPAGLAAALADVLDLPLAGEEIPAPVTAPGDVRRVPDEVRHFIDTDALTYVHHESIEAGGVGLEWRLAEGVPHATGPEGLARALCWKAGAWHRRHLVARVLTDPDRAPFLLAEADLE
ncbi:sacsin N-terminal ATP-binding-like domain-containing protein [Nocardiopsis potens]|uniref:sacsin N-terminal ATP-binding-like domain-containing protein n=1 Tax=Nocardiopsis potens TaxID=1246458 RepID=UPI0003454254|nr:hypothetical protein [Nocardiopsis potens]